MKRIILVLTVALVMAAMMAASMMPAFAEGPEGGNPGRLLCFQGRTVGAENLQPLPFGGQTSEVLPGGNEAGLVAATGVVFTAPGSPFSEVNPSAGCLQ